MTDLRESRGVTAEELERLRQRVAELEARDQAIRFSINGIALSDLSGTLTFVNRSFLQMWGYEEAREVLGRSAASFWESEDVAERIIQALGEKGVWAGEMTAKRKDGERFPVQLSAAVVKNPTGSPIGMMGSFVDITERARAEARVRSVTRLYAFLSQINQAMVRSKDQDDLFRTICRVAIEFGGFRMAWIGLRDVVAGTVRPAAHAGHDDGYLELLSVSTGSVPEGKGPTGSALREGTLVVCYDVATDPRMEPWRHEALARGYRSSAAIPFRVKDQVVGALSLYASDEGFLVEEERTLLTEIGIEVSFALDNMERARDRTRAEAALRQSEETYRALFETMAQGVVYQGPDGRILSANPAAERILGLTLEQMQGRSSLDPRWRAIREDGSDFAGDRHPAMESLRTGKPVSGVMMGVFLPTQDEYRWILVDAVPEFLPGETRPHRVYATFTDVTERRKAQAALQAAKEYAENLIDTANSIVVGMDADGNVTVFNRAAEAITGYSRSELQ